MPGLLIEQASVMESPRINGTQQPIPNGVIAKPAVNQNGGHIGEALNGATQRRRDEEGPTLHNVVNGVAPKTAEEGASDHAVNRLDGLPVEIRHLTQHFRPFHKVVHRSVQQTFNTYSDILDQLSELTVTPSLTAPNASYVKPQINGAASVDQTSENLEKKDRILKFQQDQRALYIKFLVLHDWFQRSRGIDQVIEISMWMHDQRTHFSQAADFIGNMKRELATWQIPNPDLQTAVEILSNGRVSTLSNLGYVPEKSLSPKGMLRTLEDINILLCARLSLHDEVPEPLSRYSIHDGRVTFIVPHEFELDLSVADESPTSQFYFIGFTYLFSQRSTFLKGRLHDDFASKINDILRRDGLLGCYNFLHDLTLSHKLNSLRRQALDMVQKQWSDSLRVNLINRTLVVQYWLNRPRPKSWIELGIKSGRRKKGRDRLRSAEPFLDLRWIPEKEENHDIMVDFDASSLSIENMLRGAISRHSSIILGRFYEQLLTLKLYAGGQHSVELSISDAEPIDCSLRIQLTNSKHVTFSIEPITGSLILQPASSLSGRTEFELNRLQSPIEDGVQHISMLRCLAAEQEFTQLANIAGWEVLQTFRLSHHELRTLFPSDVLRYVLIRQHSWQQNAMVAATFSMESDNWWLLYPGMHDSARASNAVLPQRIPRADWQEGGTMNSTALFSQLKEYASGAIAFKVAEQELKEKSLKCQLPALPQLQKDVSLPLMKVQYALTDGERITRSSMSDAESKEELHNDKKDENPSWIQPTVCLRFCGLNKTKNNALLLAKGRTTASAKVLESLKSLVGSNFKTNTKAGEFLMSFQVPIGISVVPELFTSLRNFDSLLSCLTIVNSFECVRIQSLSLSQIAIEYNQKAELSTSIDFPSSKSSIAIRLLPEGLNPHARISHFIKNLLADRERPFTANLGGVLTMLSTTYPLLTLFDELEKLQTLSDPAVESKASSPSTIRLHAIARSPTHYALQYFASSTNASTMIARIEIFRHLRRDTPVWILRPAIEETLAYSRSSFIDTALKQKLTDDIFNIRGAHGWLGLDTGASCPIDSPGPLVRKVDEVVRTWAKEYLKDLPVESQRQEQQSLKDETRALASESAPVPNHSANPATHHQQHQQHQQPHRPGPGGSNPTNNGATQGRPATNAQKPPSQRQQGAKDVITLD